MRSTERQGSVPLPSVFGRGLSIRTKLATCVDHYNPALQQTSAGMKMGVDALYKLLSV